MIKVKNNRQYHSSLKTSKLEKKKKGIIQIKGFYFILLMCRL